MAVNGGKIVPDTSMQEVIVIDGDSEDDGNSGSVTLQRKMLPEMAHRDCVCSTLHSEVFHLVCVVEEVSSLLTSFSEVGAEDPCTILQGPSRLCMAASHEERSACEPVDSLLASWRQAVYRLLATPFGAKHAAMQLRARLERHLRALEVERQEATVRHREYSDKNCELETRVRGFVREKRKKLQQTDGGLEKVIESESWLQTIAEHDDLLEEFKANKRCQEDAVRAQKSTKAGKKLDLLLIEVVTAITPIASAKQVRSVRKNGLRDWMSNYRL